METRKPLTSKTWADYPDGIGPDTRPGWDVDADLAYELSQRSHLNIDQCRHLVELTTSGLPIVLTWDTYLPELEKTQRITTTVLVDQILPPSVDHPDTMPGIVRVHYCGFGHPIYLHRIKDIQNVEKIVTFRDTEE